MLITQAPLRISFFGGGTDFPGHFERHGGAVLATAIRRFAYVTIQKFNPEFFDHRLRVSYRKTEAVNHAAELEHPAIRASLLKAGIEDGIELHHMADLPARTGLGSSSSFVVALLQAVYAYQGRFCSASSLAEDAIDVERRILRETGGYQDQIIAAYGGICLIRFERTGTFSVSRLALPRQRIQALEDHLLLLYTGIQRDSARVLGEHVQRMSLNQPALCRMAQLAEDAAQLLGGTASILEFGELLHEGWQLKRGLADVSLEEIDEAYERGRQAGASGGKLLGAGRGGFLLFIARPEDHPRICGALPQMRPIQISVNAPGASVIFC